MPKAATSSRNSVVPPQRAHRRLAGAGTPTAHPVRSLPADMGDDIPTISRSPQHRQEITSNSTKKATLAAINSPRKDFDVVHANCKEIIQKTEQSNRTLADSIRKQAENYSECRAQMVANIREFSVDEQKAMDKASRLANEVSQLQERLDTAISDYENLISR
ncbi:hypothetical protein N7495_003858 [Penicillium taxi]|uniref:uncharacterized protein n=1 Tax=Penicillium taxi TaxID=168475 RepID=UPI0025456BD8|nr:uncharacterized protein N7495_003858 [Penicillium taxi]KAJ5899114.1 hypothetical protein N7495_003858 [Penicillium taxi]